MRRQLVLLCVAAQFLTRLPLPATLPSFESRWLAASTRFFPLIGALVGLLVALLWAALARILPDAVAVGLMLAASLLITGAFHEDGFADACDGFGGGVTRAQVLAIMKDSRIGAYGAIGLVMLLGLKWTVLAALPPRALPLLVIGAHMWSRFCALWLLWRLPYARAGEPAAQAKSAPFASRMSAAEWLFGGALGTVVLVLLATVTGRTLGWELPRGAVLVGTGLAAAVTLLWAAYCRRRIGGHTGDCLGAAQQLAELAFFTGALAVAGGALAVAGGARGAG